MSQDSECPLVLVASQRDHCRCVLGSKSCKDAKSRLPKLLKLANGLGILSSSDVRDRIFLPLGRARDKFFTGVLGRSGQRVKICGADQGNGIRTLCHETALRDFANSGSGTLFWGWGTPGSFENLLGKAYQGGLFLGPGQGVRPCRLVQNSLEDSEF